MSRQNRTVLFDLDGTLLDTAPDMVAAMNQLLLEENRAVLPFESLRNRVSHGSTGLITAAYGTNLESEELQRLCKRFLDIYANALAVNTVLFEGIAELLDTIEQRNISWGIVTNKPQWLTDRILCEMNIFVGAGCILCGDSLAERKPHPAPLQHAARLLKSKPEHCLYVGDAERDIQAGRAAGMTTVIASYGYIDPHEFPGDWQADGSVAHPNDLKEWLKHAGND